MARMRSAGTGLLAIGLALATVHATPARAAAFACGGGSRFLETEVGEWCLELEESGALADDALAQAESFARDRRGERWLREIAARVAGEARLLRHEHAPAEAMLRLARRLAGRSGRSDHALDASIAVALLGQGRGAEAGPLAERAAAAVCDRWDIRTSTSFDEVATCRRAWGVLRALAEDDAVRAALDARWARFARARAVSERVEIAQMRRSDCIVAGNGPPGSGRASCADLAPAHDPDTEIARPYERCAALPDDARARCHCSAACGADYGDHAVGTPLAIRFDTSLRDHRHLGVDLEIDAAGRPIECRIVIEAVESERLSCGG